VDCWSRSLDGDVDDADVLVGLVCLGVDLDVGDPLHHLHAFSAPPEHRVLVVQPRLQRKKKSIRRAVCMELRVKSNVFV